MKQNKQITLADVLNTKSKDEQLQRVQSLIKMVQAPIIDIIVRFDARSGQIGTNLVGVENLPAKDIVEILEAAAKSIREQEVNMLKEKVKENEPDPEPAEE